MHVAEGWAETAARKKLIPEGSHIAGEEWISGPYAVMSGLNGYMQTISQLDGKKFLDHLHTRETVTGQTAVQVLPHSIWESILLSGIKGEIWMRKGVNKSGLPPMKWSAVMFRKTEDRNGYEATQAGRNCHEATAS